MSELQCSLYLTKFDLLRNRSSKIVIFEGILLFFVLFHYYQEQANFYQDKKAVEMFSMSNCIGKLRFKFSAIEGARVIRSRKPASALDIACARSAVIQQPLQYLQYYSNHYSYYRELP